MNLNDLTSKELKRLLQLRRQAEAIETEMAAIFKAAGKREPSLALTLRDAILPRKTQPTLREMISGILEKTERPLSVSEIYEASIATGYHWRSQDPINALNVKMYTDKTFKKVAPGRFVLRRKPGSK